MKNKHYKYNDGGRADAGYKGTADDCTVRAIAIATALSYKKVYSDLFALNRKNNKPGSKASPRDRGTHMKTIKEYMDSLGWTWEATMGIGTGCKVHLKAKELPFGRIVCRVSKHMVATIDGVVNDTYDCSRDGKRCVYGYFYNPSQVSN